MMKLCGIGILVFLQINYISLINTENEFVSLWSSSKVSEFNDYNVAVISSEMTKRTELSLQLSRKSIITFSLYRGIADKISMRRFSSRSMRKSFPLAMTLYRNDTIAEYCLTKVLHNVEIEKENFLIFIQLDQQAYRPGDEVKYRVLVVDQQLKPFHMNNINIEIRDAQNQTVIVFDSCDDYAMGICSEIFKLDSNSIQGYWQFNVIVDKKRDQIQTKKFIVSNNMEQYSSTQKENLLVTYQKNPKLDENVDINISSSKKLDRIIAFVTSRYGIVETHQTNCNFQATCKFTIKISKSMMPQSKIIVYNINDQGAVLHGETVIKTDELGDNFLKISLPPSVYVNQSISISFETNPKSNIFLMGFKNIITNTENSNEIINQDVINGLSDKIPTIYNSVITLNSWKRCSDEEINRVINGRVKVVPHSGDYFIIDDEDVGDNEDLDEYDSEPNNSNISKMLNENQFSRTNFSNKWIYEDFMMQTGHIEKSFRAPSTPGVWRISAFSLGRSNSLAVESKDILVVNRN